MAKDQWITLTKIDAAKRQVRQAIELWFANADAVSIHTLLYASVEIIHSLYRRATGKRLFFQNDAMKKTGLIKVIKDWPNFFKHGREDHELNRVLDFNPSANLVLFSACIAGLAQIDEGEDDLMAALAFYLLIHYPDFFDEAARAHRPKGQALAYMRRLSKKSFLKAFLKGARRRRRRAAPSVFSGAAVLASRP